MQDEIAEPPGSHEPTEYKKQPKKAAASGWIGSALEYYDFFIYAQAAALVFPNIFFPKTDPQIAIIAAFATFGVGYVARPIGASTLLVAFLPTYEQVGLLAPALLVVLRLIQGFAVGGEISGAASTRPRPSRRRPTTARSRSRRSPRRSRRAAGTWPAWPAWP